MTSRASFPRYAVGTVIAAMILATAPAGPATAQQTASAAKLIGKFGDWQAFEAGTGGSRVCVALSRPTQRLPETLKRDPASLFITHRPGQGVKNEISMTVGFPMKDAQDATVKIGTATFAMYTKNENAWVRNVTDEPGLLAAMRKGKAMTFVAVSKRGNKTTDNYSLAGLSDALDTISKSCK
jgi:invasion protein IalB